MADKNILDSLFDGDDATKEANHFKGWNQRKQYSVEFIQDVRDQLDEDAANEEKD